MQSPFIPFIILFCHVIETSDPSDLELMRGLTKTLEPTSNKPTHTTCSKQHRLFEALYEVAAKYVEVRSSVGDVRGGPIWSAAQQQYGDGTSNTASDCLGLGPLSSEGGLGDLDTRNSAMDSSQFSTNSEPNKDRSGLMDGPVRPTGMQNTAYGDIDMEMDFSGAQLWDWFNKNQSIMNMIEDT